MADKNGGKSKIFVSLTVGKAESRIERLGDAIDGHDRIRLYGWSGDSPHDHPLDLTEKELALLLQRAIQSGILSPNFLKDLHAAIEI